MSKKNKEGESLQRMKQAIRKNNQAVFLATASIFLLSLIGLSFLVLLSMLDTSGLEQVSLDQGPRNERLIGGDKDSGGCLVGAGYSWCEAKGKCLRVWEEPCDASSSGDEESVKKYLSDNIASLAPERSRDGGMFNVSEVNFLSDRSAFVGYDDGKDFYNAEVVFEIAPNKEVKVEKFVIKNKNGEENDLQSCTEDSDCVPMPSECHPRSCINKGHAEKYIRPEVCTMMFDPQAAYQAGDCACDGDNHECLNKNLKTGVELE